MVKDAVLWLVGLGALVASVAVAITIGPADLSVRDVFAVINDHAGGRSSGLSTIRDAIVWDLRLPRTLLAAVCGAGLAVCGAVMQALLRNPLADPYVLGISSGASTGAVAVLVLGFGAGTIGLGVGAFAGAVFSFVVVLASLSLDAFTFGEDAAATLGVPVTFVRATLLVITALLTAILVSAAGAIGFVGLVLPHAARALVGPFHRRLLPVTALVGALFLVWVDTLGRTVLEPQEIPVGW